MSQAIAESEDVSTQLTRANNNRVLLEHTKNLPCKIIEINGKPYVERYFVGEDKFGYHSILHHFLTADAERLFHNHPWSATSEILSGGYREEILHKRAPDELMEILEALGDIKTKRITESRWLKEGDHNVITPETVHRIAEVIPDTWTALTIAPQRLDQWFFIDEETGLAKIIMDTTPKDWWKTAKTRDGGEPDASQFPHQ